MVKGRENKSREERDYMLEMSVEGAQGRGLIVR